MRIRISGIDTPIADEKRAYAEYRVFTAIAPYEPQVGAVDVVVGRELAARRQFLCAVSVDLGRSGHIKTQARSMRPSAAIDRAADRAAWLIGRRIGRDFSVKADRNAGGVCDDKQMNRYSAKRKGPAARSRRPSLGGSGGQESNR